MRLLPQILGQQLPRTVQRRLLVLMHRAHDQLRAVDLIQAAPRPLRANFQPLQRHMVIVRRHTVVQHRPVRDLPRQLHHLRPRRADHDRHIARRLPPVHHIQFNPVHLVKLALECDILHRQQPPRDLHRLPHRLQRPAPADAHILRQRVPPRAHTADHAVRRQVVQRQKSGCQQPDIARPVIDNARPDLNPLRDRSERRHRHNRVPHQPAFRLPNRLKPLLLRVAHMLHSLTDRMFILQIKCNAAVLWRRHKNS